MYPLGVESATNLVGLACGTYKLYREARDAISKQREARKLIESFDKALRKLEEYSQYNEVFAGQVKIARESWQEVADYIDRHWRKDSGTFRNIPLKIKWAVAELDGKMSAMVDDIVHCLQPVGISMMADLIRNVKALDEKVEGMKTPADPLINHTVVGSLPVTPMNLAQTPALLCWQRKGGCGCTCHEITKISPQSWRFAIVRFHGLMLPDRPCEAYCNQWSYGMSARLVFTFMGKLLAFDVALEYNKQSVASSIWPCLSIQRVQYVRRYTAPAFVELEKLQHTHEQPSYQRISNIKRLFSSGEAHPLDVDPKGTTWLEKLLQYPWSLDLRDAQWDLIEFVSRESPEIRNNGKLLLMCAKWIGEGPHMEMLETLLGLGLDPGNLNSALLRKWPAMSSPNWLAEEFVGDPFFIMFLRKCLEKEPGFAGCDGLFEAVLVEDDAMFEQALYRSKTNQDQIRMSKNAFGQRAIHCAAVCSPKRLVRLLECGVDPDAVDDGGSTALMYTAAYGCRESMLVLLNYGANPYLHDERNGRYFVDYAFRRGQWLLIESLITSEAKAGFLTMSLLYYLSARTAIRDIESLQKLFRWGADPNSTYACGSTTLHQAVCVEEAREILDAGFTHVDRHDSDGMTPLMSFVERHSASEIVIRLLGLGALVNVKDASGWTALHYACKAASSSGPNLSGKRWDENQLFWKSDSIASIHALLKSGADITSRDNCDCACSEGGCSPMTIALNALGSRSHSSRETLDISPVQFLAACKFHGKNLTSACNDVRRFRAFKEANLSHTCCRRDGYLTSRSLSPFQPDGETSEDQVSKAKAIVEPRTRSYESDEDLLLELARLYMRIEDQDQEAYGANSQQIAKTKAKRPPQPDLVVDYERDEFRGRTIVCSLGSPSKFHDPTYQAFLDACIEKGRHAEQKSSVMKIIDLQKDALSTIGDHLRRLRHQEASAP